MKKRALSLLMAVIMVVSLLPTAVWAAGTGISSFFENFEDILVSCGNRTWLSVQHKQVENHYLRR